MKLFAIAMLFVGAFAVQDTAPPVISLSLDGATMHDFTIPHHHGHGRAHVARSCDVQRADNIDRKICPNPECTAHDHHDGSVQCQRVVTLINWEGKVTGAPMARKYPKGAELSWLSMWLYKYDATDASGNHAEQVTFELTIHDHVDPTLTISAPWDVDITHRTNSNAQSCNMNDGRAVYGDHPCTWHVRANKASANDNYNGNIYNRIKSYVCPPNARCMVADHEDRKINTHTLGTWALHWSVCDKAAQYGVNGANNCVSTSQTTTIADTWVPILTLKHANHHKDNTYECGVEAYEEKGAWCKDLHDSWVGGRWHFDAIPPIITGPVDHLIEGKYTVTYNCADALRQSAAPIRRVATVVDTRNPVITLVGDSVVENSAGAHRSTDGGTMDTGLFDADAMHAGARCTDECYKAPVIVSKLHYGGECTGEEVGNGDLTNFPEYTAGDYSVKYVCTDKPSGLTASVCRKIQNVDHTRPVIQILGSDNMTLEATHEGNYIDDGATCSDQVDGVISQNVEVSGDVVNLSKVGAYTITYNCKDSAGNAAPTLSRNVHVKQTSCPTCVITGATTLDHEASFPYTDAGALCTDIIDGRVETIVHNPVDVQTTGVYTITYRAQNSVGLYNDGLDAQGQKTDSSGCRGTAITYTRVVTVQDTLKPVIKLTYKTEKVAWGQGGAANNPFKEGEHTKHVHLPGNMGYMAEEASTSTVNGWVLGAIASAVTGLALLGYSQRKTTVATSVPV